jgi:O-antigen/teichoic acid export membrane protein
MATFGNSKSVFMRQTVPWLGGVTRSELGEYVPTFLTEFSVMASQIVLYKLAAHYLGKMGFSEYALARRTVSLLFPIPVLGLAVGLPRYIGFSTGQGDPAGGSRYYGATLWCVGSAAFVFLVTLNVFARPFAYLFFGDAAYRYLAFPLSLMIVGLCLHTVVCGYFRGRRLLNRANILQLINLGIVPVLAFLMFGQSLTKVLVATGVFSLAIASVGLFWTPFQAITKDNRKETKELSRYGIQRVPGDFVLVALFTLPATFVAHLQGIQAAGFVAFGVSVVSMIGGMFAPVGLVLLPKATFMLAGGARKELRAHLRVILLVTLVACTATVFLVWFWVPGLVRLYLGAGFEQVVPIARTLIFAALPYSLYLVLRNLVDAYHEHGATAAILAIGLAVFLTASYVARDWGAHTSTIPAAFLLGQFTIAALSGAESQRILHRSTP